MKISFISTLAVAFLLSSGKSSAQLCSTYTPYVDGCTFPSSASAISLAVKPFRSLWRSQCDQHDRNYQVLGKSKQSSDSKLYEDMRGRCDSEFHKIFMAPTNQVCRSAARAVYTALKNVDSSKYYKPNQRRADHYTNSLSDNVNANICQLTAKKANVFDDSLVNEVNAIFNREAGRKPTAYEELRALKLYDADSGMTTFKNAVTSFARNLRNVQVPHVKINSISEPWTFGKDASGSSGQGLKYFWNINGEIQTTPQFKKMLASQYNVSHRMKGSLIITHQNGQRDLEIIDELFFVRGICGPNPSYECF